MKTFSEIVESAETDNEFRAEARKYYRLARNTILDALKEHPDLLKYCHDQKIQGTQFVSGEDNGKYSIALFYNDGETTKGYPDCRGLYVSMKKSGSRDKPFTLAFLVPKDPRVAQQINRSGVFSPYNNIASNPIAFVFGSLRQQKTDEPLDPTEYEYFVDDAGMKSVAIHELAHALQHRNLGSNHWSGALSSYVDYKKDYTGYINHPEEINARYYEWAESVLVDIANQVARQRKTYPNSTIDLAKMYPTFQKFLDVYGDAYFVPIELYKNWTPETKKRLMKRFYKLYDYIKHSTVQWDESDAIRNIMIAHEGQVSDSEDKNRIAGKMGLKYIGFGRFVNKDDEVVYIKKDGKLKPFHKVIDMSKFLRKN